MTRRLLALCLAALLPLGVAACDDTIQGVEQDVQEGVDEVDEELNEDESADR